MCNKTFKIIFCLNLIISLISALPLDREREFRRRSKSNTPTIIKYDAKNFGKGDYKFAYQTSDGIIREESSQIVNLGKENEAFVLRGYYSYIGTDGRKYAISYIADENGFRPTGIHIPTVLARS